MDGKYVCSPDRQYACPSPYHQQGCYLGEFFPQPMLQEAPMPILSTSPKMAGRGARPFPVSKIAKEGNRPFLDWRDDGRQPVPPGYVMCSDAMGGTGIMPCSPIMRECSAPSAALGLLEATPHFGCSQYNEAATEASQQSSHEGTEPLHTPLLIRNTFLDAKPVRSPSLDNFFQERQVKSSPPSGPPSGKLEYAAPRSGFRHCSIFDALMNDDASSAAGMCASGLSTQLEQAPQIHGLPVLSLSEANALYARDDLSGLATPELSYRESWRPAPLAGRCSGGGSSSGGSAECASSASIAASTAATATPGGGGARPEGDRDRPFLGSPDLPSRGSALHQWGACKPCAFVFQEGCKNDIDCQFCHLCEPGERKRRKKERLAMKREVREEARRRRQEAGEAAGGWRPRHR